MIFFLKIEVGLINRYLIVSDNWLSFVQIEKRKQNCFDYFFCVCFLRKDN